MANALTPMRPRWAPAGYACRYLNIREPGAVYTLRRVGGTYSGYHSLSEELPGAATIFFYSDGDGGVTEVTDPDQLAWLAAMRPSEVFTYRLHILPRDVGWVVAPIYPRVAFRGQAGGLYDQSYRAGDLVILDGADPEAEAVAARIPLLTDWTETPVMSMIDVLERALIQERACMVLYGDDGDRDLSDSD